MGFINLGNHTFDPQRIPESCDVVFVSDLFINDYVGGAELTSEALIASSPLSVHRIKSKDVTLKSLEQGFQKYWIFGNFSNLDQSLIPTICANMRYSIIEYDFKFCKYRSPEKHREIELAECNCSDSEHGKLISALFYAARSLWWMSEKQQALYERKFPFLRERPSTVLSSVFDDAFFVAIKKLRSNQVQRKGWVVLGSQSWIKGTEDAIEWCRSNGHEFDVVSNLSYDKLLEKLASSEGLVFLPKGADTCPRIVIEAKLLGCKLQLNDNVQHRNEIWFDTDDMFDTEAYLYMSRERFWNGIKADMDYRPKLSGYTTTKDCVKQDYPFEECIQSMLGFCDEVIIVDGGSTDGTWERLQAMAAADARVVIHQQKRDWSHPRFAVFDGLQKALARSLCTGDFCWQQDSDEIVHEDDYKKVRDLVKLMPRNVTLLSLPVIEYWGGPQKVRCDVNVWKWRLSQNVPSMTHGIPKELRAFDDEGELYSRPGSDGCWYVKHDSYEMLPAASFYTPDVEALRQKALAYDPVAIAQFRDWFNQAILNLPSVHHFSWFNIRRKIRTYRDYWSQHWQSLHNITQADSAENNMFFDKPWTAVSEKEIDELAERLSTQMGGWIFHRKVDFTRTTPSISVNVRPPKIMDEWMKRNS